MIIARGDKDGESLLLLGLSRENLNRLVDGSPILLSRRTHGDAIPEGWQISIVFGETEKQIAEQLKPAMSDETRIVKDPRL